MSIEESTRYDNFLGKSETLEPRKSKLPIKSVGEVKIDQREKLWVGMPEFVQDENAPFKTIYVHFRTEEDFNEFVTKYKSVEEDQLITKKTKSMWYPRLDREENSLKRWMEKR